jgi:hypothetical protein
LSLIDLNHDSVAASGEERLSEGIVDDPDPPPLHPARNAPPPTANPKVTSPMRLTDLEPWTLGNGRTSEL